MTAPRAAKVCPRKISEPMVDAGIGVAIGYLDEPFRDNAFDIVIEIWRAMYDAAPAAPSDDALAPDIASDICAARDDAEAPVLRLIAALSAIESLTAELAQAREDARRYRRLRDNLLAWVNPRTKGSNTPADIDAAFDAALAEQEGK